MTIRPLTYVSSTGETLLRTCTKIVCTEEGCGIVLVERPAPAPPGDDAQYMRVASIEGADPPVVDGTYKMRLASIGDELTDDLADRRAAAAVAIGGRDPDPNKRPTPDVDTSLGRIVIAREPAPSGPRDADVLLGRVSRPRTAPWRCPECLAHERKMLPDGASRCARGHVSRDEGGAVA